MSEPSLENLLRDVRACRHCADRLQFGPRPVLHIGASARLLIISQAPGVKVHLSGLSFDDRSGDRLRDWLGIDRTVFYDSTKVALMGSAFCYPGVDAHGGDLPPSPDCAPLWHSRLLPFMPAIGLTLLVGGYSQRRYLNVAAAESISSITARWRDFLPKYFALPHPSWRNNGWIKKNPWFEAEALPELRRRVAVLIA